MPNQVSVTIFSMLATLGKDFISKGMEEGFHMRVTKGIEFNKPTIATQALMYDKDNILSLYPLGVYVQKIISTHLGYSKYLSLKSYIKKTEKTYLKFFQKKERKWV